MVGSSGYRQSGAWHDLLASLTNFSARLTLIIIARIHMMMVTARRTGVGTDSKNFISKRDLLGARTENRHELIHTMSRN